MSGNSSTHAGQYVPQKLTHTGRPRTRTRSIAPPPPSGTLRVGAGSPTWNSAPGEAAGADGSPEADGDGLPAIGDGLTRVRLGAGGGGGRRGGRAARAIPPFPSRAAPPATTVSLPDIGGRVPVRPSPGRSDRTLVASLARWISVMDIGHGFRARLVPAVLFATGLT